MGFRRMGAARDRFGRHMVQRRSYRRGEKIARARARRPSKGDAMNDRQNSIALEILLGKIEQGFADLLKRNDDLVSSNNALLERARSAERRLAELIQEAESAREVLAPFARIAESFNHVPDGDRPINVTMPLSDLRRARSFFVLGAKP